MLRIECELNEKERKTEQKSIDPTHDVNSLLFLSLFVDVVVADFALF